MLLCLQSVYPTLVWTDVFMPIFDIDVTLETIGKKYYTNCVECFAGVSSPFIFFFSGWVRPSTQVLNTCLEVKLQDMFILPNSTKLF